MIVVRSKWTHLCAHLVLTKWWSVSLIEALEFSKMELPKAQTQLNITPDRLCPFMWAVLLNKQLVCASFLSVVQ
jgi:hypothetical protein